MTRSERIDEAAVSLLKLIGHGPPGIEPRVDGTYNERVEALRAALSQPPEPGRGIRSCPCIAAQQKDPDCPLHGVRQDEYERGRRAGLEEAARYMERDMTGIRSMLPNAIRSLSSAPAKEEP
jgi:hypothetical protein